MRKVYLLLFTLFTAILLHAQNFGTTETELYTSISNNTAATAQAITSPAKVKGNIYPNGDIDFYSFTANAGDRVYAAVMTSFSAGSSTDCQLTLIASDGTTVIEFDDDNGSFAGFSSSIAGAIIPASGTYYLKVNDFTAGTTTERGYDLYLKVQSGAPVAEVESNDSPATANVMPASGWVSGARNPATATEQDWFAVTLAAGESVFISADWDPEKDNVSYNGRLGFGLFGDAGNQILVIDDAGTGDVTPNPNRPSEAFFFTAKDAGTYYVFADAASAAVGGPTATYHISYTKFAAETGYVNTPSADVPKTIGPGTGSVTSTLTVPGNPRIKDMSVRITLNHALMGDIDATLTSPSGNIIHLFTDIGATATGGQTQMDMFLNDNNAIPPSFTVLKGVGMQPEVAGKLDQFKNQNAGGTWTLTLYDDGANASGGTLTAWSLDILPDNTPNLANAITIFSTDFESGADGFTHSGTGDQWALGTPNTAATTTANPVAAFTTANSGVNAWKTNLTGTYNISTDQTLKSPSIALPVSVSPLWISWAMKYQMESANFDHLTVSVQQVGNPATAKTLFEWLGATQTASVGNPTVNVPQSAGWGTWYADVSSFAGQNIEFLVRLVSDNTVNFGGAAIDDFKVYRLCEAPAVTGNPANSAVCDGANASFSITATGTTLTYQWQVNTGSGFVNISDGGVYAGTGTNALSITGATPAMNGYLYRCVVTNGCGTANSNQATLTVNNLPTAVATPSSQNACSGSAITTIVLSGTGTTYTWSRDNNVTVTGIAANGTGDISGTLVNTTGAPVTVTFTITPSDVNCTGVPITATVTVYPVPVVNAPAVTQPTCLVPTGTIVVNATGSGTLEYSLNGGAYQVSNTFSGLAPGNYNIAVRIQAAVSCPVNYAGNPVVLNPPGSVVSLPISHDFVPVSPFLPAGWSVVNPNGNNTWVRNNNGNGNAGSAFIDNYNFNLTGQVDEIRTPPFNTGNDSVIIEFDYAYKNFPGLNDRLQLMVSSDCGATFNTGTNPVFDRAGAALATAGSSTANYTTPAAGDWKHERIAVFVGTGSPYAANQIMIASFKMTNGYGNNLFIDNINIKTSCVPASITCPANITVSNAVNQCSNVVTYTPTTGGSTPVAVSYVFSGATTGSGSGDGSGSTFNVGTTLVTLTAVNACGTANCSFNVTVNDTQAPTISCPAPVTVSCAAAVPAVNTGSVTASDNCPGVVVTHIGDVISAQTCANRYTLTRTYRATDAAGNFSECTQIITVNDVTPPTITCPAPVTVSCASAVPAVNTGAVTASDNCGGVVTITHISDVISGQTCANRYTLTRTYRATDVCGNFAECTQIITVNDVTPPTITCPAPVTVSCASAVPAVNTGAVTASDNCGGVVTITHISDVISAQTCANRYTITRTYRATDVCGNFAQCARSSRSMMQTPPTLTCPANDYGRNNPRRSAVVTFTATDNCGGAVTITSVPASGSTFP
ncbi:MAG: PKD-like domain-containing protein [Chitinophagaceae bacterium]